MLHDAKKGEQPIEELCRDFGCSPAPRHTWKKKDGDTTADEAKRPRELEQENARVLRIVGQQRLELEAVMEVWATKR